MTHWNDELEYVCAWGRWRIGQALNEPVAARDGEWRVVEHRTRTVERQRAPNTVERPRAPKRPARLRLVVSAATTSVPDAGS